MITKSISNLNVLKILDESSLQTYYGCDQAWYTTEWQRISGCGPSVVSNIILYLTRPTLGAGQSLYSKEKCLSLMEEIWDYVTPIKGEGIPSTKMLYENVLMYATSKGIQVEYEVCDLFKKKFRHPKLEDVVIFLEEALLKDTPIAFVNLCNGDEKNLDPWHWVTIVSLEYSEAGNNAFVTILDEGIIKTISLGLWYNTTTLGGGFVYFTAPVHRVEKQ